MNDLAAYLAKGGALAFKLGSAVLVICLAGLAVGSKIQPHPPLIMSGDLANYWQNLAFSAGASFYLLLLGWRWRIHFASQTTKRR